MSSGVDPLIGMVVNNKFVIEEKLGSGGFGAVYRGTEQGIDRKVALKVLHPELALDENLVARFKREGRVLCKFRDPHTITTYESNQTPNGMLYIAMELLEGKSLHDVYHDEAPLAWRRMIKIISQMCSSLAEAHDHGVVHRDLKPENIYLENLSGDPEFVKILDFGIAKVIHGDGIGGQAAQLTATGQTLGTLEYMSPEQLMGKQLDGRSDVYALGVLTYEMITKRLPFPDAKGPAQLITAQLRKVPEPPSAACPSADIPPEVDQIVLRMLEKEPDKRFPGVSDLRTACVELLKREPSHGQRAAQHTPMPPQPVAPSPSYPPHQMTPPPTMGPQGNPHDPYGNAQHNHGRLDSYPPGQPGPGTMPPGGQHPGTMPPGGQHPGTMPPGMVTPPPSFAPGPGSVPPGMMPPGSVPGAPMGQSHPGHSSPNLAPGSLAPVPQAHVYSPGEQAQGGAHRSRFPLWMILALLAAAVIGAVLALVLPG